MTTLEIIFILVMVWILAVVIICLYTGRPQKRSKLFYERTNPLEITTADGLKYTHVGDRHSLHFTDGYIVSCIERREGE